jgi:hypothetical protein
MKTYVDTTVVIPTKGERSNLLKKAIAEIYRSIYLPEKIIIAIDNNISAYNNFKIIFKTYDNIIIKNNTGKNGVSATRNFGVKFVNTTYISFLDDDDYWEKDYLKEIFSNNHFDISLVGFKKKKGFSLVNEKLPPLELKPIYFLIKNPGIRGSNITITKDLFEKVGGFNENLLSFNDMDFGLRLCEQKNIRYKAVQKHLVIFNSHDNDRISTAGSKENIQGLTEFLIIHGNKMSYESEASFRKRAIQLWNVDPYSDKSIENRFQRIKDDKEKYNAQFSNLLHAAETILLENIYKLDSNINNIQKFIDKLCYQYEEHNKNRKFSIKIAFTTTNSKYTVQNLIQSAISELDQSKFNYKSNKPTIEFLVIENSSDNEIIKSNKLFCSSLSDDKVAIKYVDWKEKEGFQNFQKPFPIAMSRAFLIKKINSLSWTASPNQPIWILDDDFEFTSTIPIDGFKIKNIRLGSIFHRMECIIKEQNLDAIVGGNSGSPPLPELSTVKLQLKDLLNILQLKTWDIDWKDIIQKIHQNSDYYYDLSRVNTEYFFVPQKNAANENKLNFADDFFIKILKGIPATRFLFANYCSNDNFNSAWDLCDKIAVSGGNTIYFNSELINLESYWIVKNNDIKSRRADAIWFLINKRKGYRIKKMNFPLTHARTKRITMEYDEKELISKELKDILGVALWETVKDENIITIDNIDKNIFIKKTRKRVKKYENNQNEIELILHDILTILPDVTKLNSFQTLLKLSKYRIKLNFKQIDFFTYGS